MCFCFYAFIITNIIYFFSVSSAAIPSTAEFKVQLSNGVTSFIDYNTTTNNGSMWVDFTSSLSSIYPKWAFEFTYVTPAPDSRTITWKSARISLISALVNWTVPAEDGTTRFYGDTPTTLSWSISGFDVTDTFTVEIYQVVLFGVGLKVDTVAPNLSGTTTSVDWTPPVNLANPDQDYRAEIVIGGGLFPPRFKSGSFRVLAGIPTTAPPVTTAAPLPPAPPDPVSPTLPDPTTKSGITYQPVGTVTGVPTLPVSVPAFVRTHIATCNALSALFPALATLLSLDESRFILLQTTCNTTTHKRASAPVDNLVDFRVHQGDTNKTTDTAAVEQSATLINGGQVLQSNNASVIYADSAPFPTVRTTKSKFSIWWILWIGLAALVMISLTALIIAIVCIVRHHRRQKGVKSAYAIHDSLLMSDPTYQPQRHDDFHSL